MYIILEGMPGTGKTTIANALRERLHAVYMKSVISDTAFGDNMKRIRSENQLRQLELLFLSDLAIDELRVISLLKNGNVVRDKSLAAAIGHLSAHGFENTETVIQKSLMLGYQQIMEYAVEPDLAVHIKADMKKIYEHLPDKDDISDIDIMLLRNLELYKKQESEIEYCMRELYQEKFFSIDSFSGSVGEMRDVILKKAEQNAKRDRKKCFID